MKELADRQRREAVRPVVLPISTAAGKHDRRNRDLHHPVGRWSASSGRSCKAYGNREKNGRGGQPIVKLAVTRMPTKHGNQPRPSFEIVGWDDAVPDEAAAKSERRQFRCSRHSCTAKAAAKQSSDMDDEIPLLSLTYGPLLAAAARKTLQAVMTDTFDSESANVGSCPWRRGQGWRGIMPRP